MKKKFFNAKIYRNDSATEFIVENGKISEIGTNLPSCDDEIDLQGKLIKNVHLPEYVRRCRTEFNIYVLTLMLQTLLLLD